METVEQHPQDNDTQNMPKLRVCLTADESLLDSVWFEVAQVAQKF